MKEIVIDEVVYQVKEFIPNKVFNGIQKRMMRLSRLQKTAVKLQVGKDLSKSELDKKWKEIFESLSEDDIENLDEINDWEDDMLKFTYTNMVISPKKTEAEIDETDCRVMQKLFKQLFDMVMVLLGEDRINEVKKKVDNL
jgi:hypothetical protein